MEKSWQDVLDRFHYGIYLVTIAADGLYNGMIASWVAQCSHTPPLITLAIRKNRLSHDQIMQTGRFTYGIYMVSVASDGMYNRMIASWVVQCSSDPPLIALAIRKNRMSHSQILGSGSFTVNVLPRTYLSGIARFKAPDWRRKFDGVDYELSPAGNPVIKGALGYLDCVVERAVDTGDHTLFIGRVTGGAVKGEGEALDTTQYPGRYRGDR